MWIRELVLPIVYESQGGCWWGVPLNGADDPPVVVCWGDHGDLWDYHAGSFSDFVCARVFDGSLWRSDGVRSEIYLSGVVRGPELRLLQQVLRVEATTRDDLGRFSYRFSGPGKRCIVTVLDPECRSLVWHLWASDEAAFRILVGELARVCPILDGVMPGRGPLYLQEGTAAELDMRQQDFPF